MVPMVAVHLIEGPGVGPSAPPVWPLYGERWLCAIRRSAMVSPWSRILISNPSYRLRTTGDGIWYAPASYWRAWCNGSWSCPVNPWSICHLVVDMDVCIHRASDRPAVRRSAGSQQTGPWETNWLLWTDWCDVSRLPLEAQSWGIFVVDPWLGHCPRLTMFRASGISQNRITCTPYIVPCILQI